MIKIIIAKNKIDCEHLLGQFLNESHFDTVINEDTDCYLESQDEQNIAFKFRKNFFSKTEQEQAYIGLRDAAVASQNRGLAAGPKRDKCGGREWVTEVQYRTLEYFSTIDPNNLGLDIKADLERIQELYGNNNSSRGLVWLAQEVKKAEFNWETWLKNLSKEKNLNKIIQKAKYVNDTFISDTTYANIVYSGIAGWFDRYPRIPYGRATSYTQNHFNKFKLSFSFLQSLDRGFKDLLPQRHAAQRFAADKVDPAFLVPGTVFTTITVNKTFRTAAHRDAGDFSNGLSNLLVLSNNGNYTGGYLILPEVRIAVNVRPGDLLLVNNHEYIHGNTPIELQDDIAERISLVCYLREKMLELGSKEYENHRFNYVECRRKNKSHSLQRKLWNGISSGMWEEQEWYDYLEKNGGREMVAKYHSEAYNKISTLEDMFG
jgi:hypothetical protein